MIPPAAVHNSHHDRYMVELFDHSLKLRIKHLVVCRPSTAASNNVLPECGPSNSVYLVWHGAFKDDMNSFRYSTSCRGHF